MPYTRNGDVEIFYETFGDPTRPTLLMVNGLGSQSINYRVEWCEMFAAEGLHVIRYDNRDVGLSTHFHDFDMDLPTFFRAMRAGDRPEPPYAMSDMAADGIAVLDAVGVERAHVMGLSMGGMIVQLMAVEHPDRLISMTSVMSTTGDPDVGRASEEAQRVFNLPPATTREEAIERNVVGKRAYGSPDHIDEDRLRSEAAEAHERSFDPAGVARQQMAIIACGSRTERLRTVSVPTLVMHGTEDGLISPDGGERTAEVIPGARLVLIEGMGHDYPPAFWRRWVDEVVAHIRANDPAAVQAG